MKYARKLLLLALAGSLIPAYVCAAQLGDKPELTLEAAKQAAAAAETAAHTKGIAVTVGVVDDGGHLIYLARLDHVASGMTDAAIMKARTADQNAGRRSRPGTRELPESPGRTAS